jgi:hypothetical protein
MCIWMKRHMPYAARIALFDASLFSVRIRFAKPCASLILEGDVSLPAVNAGRRRLDYHGHN